MAVAIIGNNGELCFIIEFLSNMNGGKIVHMAPIVDEIETDKIMLEIFTRFIPIFYVPQA